MSAAITVTGTACFWTMERNVCASRALPIRCCAGGFGPPSPRGRVYAEVQPGQILPGLRGADAPEERSRTAEEKIPPVYAFRPVKTQPWQGFSGMVGGQAGQIIQSPPEHTSKCVESNP